MKLEELADRIAIQELTAQYNYFIDSGELDQFMALFVPDAEFAISGTPAIKGHDDIRQMMSGLPWGHIHLTTDSVVEVTGDRGAQRCSFIVLGRRTARGQESLVATGRYFDEFVRTADGWRFASRRIDLDIELDTMFGLLVNCSDGEPAERAVAEQR